MHLHFNIFIHLSLFFVTISVITDTINQTIYAIQFRNYMNKTSDFDSPLIYYNLLEAEISSNN